MASMPGEQGGQVVLVTGAAGNLGQAVARAFADRGAALVLTDHSKERLDEAAPRIELPAERCLTLVADVTRLEAVQELCRAARARFGRIDVVVNVAGGFGMGRVHETSPETWDLLLDLNARSVFNMAHGVVPAMIEQGRGRIINVAARPALSATAMTAVYAASKAAVLRLTEGLAAELLPHGITVNSVLPGTIDTPQNRQAMPGEDPRRWVAPDSLAGVIVFLASDAARDISGAAIPVYGRS